MGRVLGHHGGNRARRSFQEGGVVCERDRWKGARFLYDPVLPGKVFLYDHMLPWSLVHSLKTLTRSRETSLSLRPQGVTEGLTYSAEVGHSLISRT